MKQNLAVTNSKLGLIEGSLCLDRSGVGHMRVEWEPLNGTWGEIDEYPWGVQLLHWDFTCEQR